MCGITGILQFDDTAASRVEVEAMTRRIAHRGPDGEGVHVREAVGLGHRRLSIIDPARGAQPMLTEDGSVAISYNGELYNFRELAEELRGLGHTFRTRSDTEVVLQAWVAWGPACVERFRGMFAFAIADWRRRVLFLARDQLGIKPLVYARTARRLAFASELQAFRVLPDCAREIDPRALDQYLYLQYIPAPRTVFRDVQKLPPAHRMLIGFDGATRGPERYWSFAFRPDERDASLDEWADRLEGVMQESVRAHLVSDVPFGAFLSGGMDSTLVVGYMARALERPVHTFTMGFEETEYDEVQYAREAARRWEAEHEVEIVKPDAIAVLPTLVRHYGEPFGDSSAIPTWYVCRLARRAVPMVLSGDGGDEAFAGYPSYQGWLNWLYPWKRPRRLRWILRHLVRNFLPPAIRPEGLTRPQTLEGWLGVIQYLGPAVRRTLWRPEHRDLVDLPVEPFIEPYARSEGYDEVHRAQYLDLHTYLPNDILAKVDIASMSHGLEVRTPLTDIRVAEFAATIPSRYTFRRGKKGTHVTKLLLRRILRRYFPESFIERRKMGFSIPLDRWFRPGGALRGPLEERLLRRHAHVHEYFDPAAVASLIGDHGRPRDLSGPLWLLFFLESWLEEFRTDPSRVVQG